LVESGGLLVETELGHLLLVGLKVLGVEVVYPDVAVLAPRGVGPPVRRVGERVDLRGRGGSALSVVVQSRLSFVTRFISGFVRGFVVVSVGVGRRAGRRARAYWAEVSGDAAELLAKGVVEEDCLELALRAEGRRGWMGGGVGGVGVGVGVGM
jgi:hypothetical protein